MRDVRRGSLLLVRLPLAPVDSTSKYMHIYNEHGEKEETVYCTLEAKGHYFI